MTIVVLSKGYVSQSITPLIPDAINVTRGEFDYTTFEGFGAMVKAFRPRFIVNCYGYTGRPNVEGCETNRAECYQRNVTDNLKITSYCKYFGIPLAYVGSGCIYDGGTFSEDDSPNFGGSYYSLTKKEAERLLSDAPPDYILRIRMPFGGIESPKDYLYKLRKYSTLITQRNSVTYLPDLASFLVALERKRPAKGIYNVCQPEPLTPREICGIIGLEDKTFFPVEELKLSVPRCNCVLRTEKAEEICRLFTVREAILAV